MRRLWSSLVVSVAFAASASPATVLKRTVDVVIDPGGKVSETYSLRVRLDSARDRDDWSPYPIYIDDNRKIDIVTAAVEKPDGSVTKVEKKALDTVNVVSGGILHDSRKYRTVAFPDAPDGSILVLTYNVTIKPYFPSDSLTIQSGAATDVLEIRITGGGPGFRYRVDGPSVLPAGAITASAGGLSLSARNLPKRPELKYAAERDTLGPVLRYGWGGPSKWADVGEWYLGLVSDVPRGAPTLAQDAAALKAADDRLTIQKLVEHVRTKVRYVAVEVGIGGYRPHPADEVRAKGWGDCKDKATLLVEMLQSVGIEAHPALILSSEDARVDADFPSPDQFNHMIVAIPESRLGATTGLPVAGGFYFVDPTQEKGGLTWFHRSTQDQQALVVRRGGNSVLVRTPKLPGADARLTEIRMTPRPSGGFDGEATLNFRGDLASYFIAEAATRRAEDFRGDAEAIVRARLPGSAATFSAWSRAESDVPDVTLKAVVTLPLAPEVRSLVLPASPFTPPLSILEGREADVVLDAPTATTRWTVKLPSGWCAPRTPPQTIENEIGLFRQKVESAGQTVTVERHLEVRRGWVSKDLFPKLRELILAEHRAYARSVRFECEVPAGS